MKIKWLKIVTTFLTIGNTLGFSVISSQVVSKGNIGLRYYSSSSSKHHGTKSLCQISVPHRDDKISALFLGRREVVLRGELPPPTTQSKLDIVAWLIYGSSIALVSFGLRFAGINEWLGICTTNWYIASITYPALVLAALLYNVLSYLYEVDGAEKVAKLMGGTIIDEEDTGQKSLLLKRSVEEVYGVSGLPLEDDEGNSMIPSIYLIPTSEPNAFAAGTVDKGTSVVAVTEGLLNRLKPNQVKAVIAHEIGHLRNGDPSKAMQVACMVLSFGFATSIGARIIEICDKDDDEDDDEEEDGSSLLGVGLILFVGGKIIFAVASLLRLASSRSVEYDADAFVKAIGYGEDLAIALEKIDDNYNRDSESLGVEGGAFAHTYISNPPSRENPFLNLFGLLRTHPTTEERVARLLDD